MAQRVWATSVWFVGGKQVRAYIATNRQQDLVKITGENIHEIRANWRIAKGLVDAKGMALARQNPGRIVHLPYKQRGD